MALSELDQLRNDRVMLENKVASRESLLRERERLYQALQLAQNDLLFEMITLRKNMIATHAQAHKNVERAQLAEQRIKDAIMLLERDQFSLPDHAIHALKVLLGKWSE